MLQAARVVLFALAAASFPCSGFSVTNTTHKGYSPWLNPTPALGDRIQNCDSPAPVGVTSAAQAKCVAGGDN